ncbi:MAG: sigma-70 family RNA polymerase sigma factor [Kofleriaceae bacterium]
MTKPLDELVDTVRPTWQRFLDVFEPLRPDLYRYCRYLTRDAWDAEDLAQDAMARAFVNLGCSFHALPAPKAWLFRVASNLWIDRMRRRRLADTRGDGAIDQDAPAAPRATREAAGTLIVQLSPQERAAVVLKDVFELSLEEIAETLATSVGAVKAALHRGRGKLADPEPDAPHVPAPGVLDEFCDAFNARDLTRLTALLLDSAAVEIVGVVTEVGRDAAAGSLGGSLVPITYEEGRGGIRPEHLDGYLGGLARCEVRQYRGQPIFVFWYAHIDREYCRCVMSVEVDGDKLVRLRNYFFTPEVIAEVCRELELPYRTNGYRYW